MKKILLVSFLMLFSLSVKADFVTAENAFKDHRYLEAFNEFLPLSETGDYRVQYYLGYMYLNGLGVIRDDKKALEYIQKSADQEYEEAQALLGFLYDEGRIIPKDKKKAIFYYEKATDKGNLFAILNLGVAYYKGDGVVQNTPKAIELFERVPLDEGHPYMGRYLGEAYMNSDDPDKVKKAEQAYRNSARFGDYESFYKLGELYESEGDLERAMKYFEYPAIEGNCSAGYALGMKYINGNDIEKNIIRGCAWLERANLHGDCEPAKEALSSLKKSMTDEQEKKVDEEFDRLITRWKTIESPYIAEERSKRIAEMPPCKTCLRAPKGER